MGHSILQDVLKRGTQNRTLQLTEDFISFNNLWKNTVVWSTAKYSMDGLTKDHEVFQGKFTDMSYDTTD